MSIKSPELPDIPALPPLTIGDYDPHGAKQRIAETRPFSGQRFERVKRGVAKAAFGVMALAVPISSYWTNDVLPAREDLAREHSTIEHISPPKGLQDADLATIELVGLGNVDAAATAETEDVYGQVWAVRYSNRGINTHEIADMIEQEAEENGVDRLNFVGHSMGGIVALEVAKYIHDESDIDVLSVVLDCTPIDLDAVRPDVRTQGEEMARWISEIPGARESRALRMLVEVSARRDRFMEGSTWADPNFDFDAFEEVMGEVMRDKILSGDAASNGLIEVQFAIITDSAARSSLKALASEKGDKFSPIIILVRPRNGNNDTVVDVDYTQRVLEDESKRNKSELVIIDLDDTGHANPNQSSGPYRKGIEDFIIPVIMKYEQTSNAPTTAELAQARPDGYTK